MTENIDDFFTSIGSSFSSNSPVPPFSPVSSVAPIEEKAEEKAEEKVTTTTTTTTAKDTIKSFKPKRFTPNNLPDLRYPSTVTEDYKTLVDGILGIYASFSKLDYNAVYLELKNLSVKSEPTPDAQTINALLEKIQASKDRVSEIHQELTPIYQTKKRSLDLMEDIWAKHSDEKSADKRKAQGLDIIAEFVMDFGYIDDLYTVCEHLLKTLDSLHDHVSRRITIMQICLKYFDMSRSASPDFSFKTFSAKRINNDSENVENAKDFDPSKGIDAEEQNF